jgi:hypothetical protein
MQFLVLVSLVDSPEDSLVQNSLVIRVAIESMEEVF